MRLCMNRIQDAAAELAPPFSQTPQYECEPLSASLGCAITLKVETLNPIRSFKGRGTQIAVSRALEAGFESVICASAGNLGQAVAYFARERGMTATVDRVTLGQQSEAAADLRTRRNAPTGGRRHRTSETACRADCGRRRLASDRR